MCLFLASSSARPAAALRDLLVQVHRADARVLEEEGAGGSDEKVRPLHHERPMREVEEEGVPSSFAQRHRAREQAGDHLRRILLTSNSS